MSTAFVDESDVHVGDVGVALKVAFYDLDADGNKVAVDLTGFSQLKLKALKPGGDLVLWDLTVVGLATEGIAQYITNSTADLDEQGDWNLQGYVEVAGSKLHSSKSPLQVDGNLEAAP